MTAEQCLGVWIVAAAFLLAGLTLGVVVIGLYMVATRQDERRYGVRRGWSLPEAGIGRRSPAVDGSTDRETLARVGLVGIEKVTE